MSEQLRLDDHIKSITVICLAFCYFCFCFKSCAQTDLDKINYWNGVSQGKKLCKEASE